jgi:TP901 family phage tail tape measure protein
MRQTKMAEFELKALITGVDRLSPELSKMGRRLKGFQKEFNGIMKTAGMAGAAMAGALVLPVQKAIAFESAMADVRKVVDFDTPEQFKQMGEDVITLSTKLPMAAEGIAAIVAAGGQAGIARQDLQQFATDAVKMGIAFDQTAEQSGEQMAQWRTAFRLSQIEVVKLADQINYLSNTSPANAQKISDVVTRIGALGEVAGVSAGDLAAIGGTIAGMGVPAEIAATGIKNFMLSLSSGKATGMKGLAWEALKLDPEKIASGMKKDSRKTMLLVLEQISKANPDKQASILETVFGRESIGAIAPMLTNLHLLRENLDKVADAQQYGGSMEKEYAARAATTANNMQLFRNQLDAVGISMGSVFLPAINSGLRALTPYIEQFRSFVKENPERVKAFARTAGALMAMAGATVAITKTLGVLNTLMKMSMLGRIVTLLVIGGTLIAQNWDKIGPIVMPVLEMVQRLSELMGGWSNILIAVAGVMAATWLTTMLASIGKVTGAAQRMNGVLASSGKMGKLGGAALKSLPMAAALYEPVNQGMEAMMGESNFGKWAKDTGLFFASDWKPFFSRSEMEQYQSGLDQQTAAGGLGPQSIKNETNVNLKVVGAPPGMTLQPDGQVPADTTLNLGYSPFSGR